MLYSFKEWKDRLLRPLSRILLAAGVIPNIVTTAGLFVAIVAGIMAASGHLSGGVILFLVAAGLDAVDGSLARASGQTTEFGLYFDGTCDRLSELVFVAGAVVGGIPPIGLPSRGRIGPPAGNEDIPAPSWPHIERRIIRPAGTPRVPGGRGIRAFTVRFGPLPGECSHESSFEHSDSGIRPRNPEDRDKRLKDPFREPGPAL